VGEPVIHVLLVEDDERLAALTAEYLSTHDIIVTRAANGEQGLAEALHHRFDAVLLDVMLPGKSGIEVCQALRHQSDVPILMITARGEEADRVLGLELGADDYLPKPFSPRELLARVRAQVRRHRGKAGPRLRPITHDDLVLDPGRYEATVAGRPIPLTAYEFTLLYALVENAGRVLSREQLMELARGSAEEAFDRSIDVHISRLRHKLGERPPTGGRIKTVRGVGYQYVEERP
jgi:DNA-binding response OmpR family regulator